MAAVYQARNGEHRSFHVSRGRLHLLACSCFLLVFTLVGPYASATLAQSGPTTTSGATTTGEPPDTVLSSKDRRFLSGAILAMASLVTVLGGTYLVVGLWRYYDTATSITGITGKLPPHDPPDPVVQVQGLDTTTLTGINIDGPAVIAVGEARQYSVTKADGSSPNLATWKAEPSGAATITPAEATAVTVKAGREGTFRLIATTVDDVAGVKTTLVATTDVQAVVETSAERASLPFVGTGYLTLLVLPMLLGVVSVLALNARLTGEAVIGLASAALGFLFGKASIGSNRSETDKASPT
jgi:hypothetical protein